MCLLPGLRPSNVRSSVARLTTAMRLARGPPTEYFSSFCVTLSVLRRLQKKPINVKLTVKGTNLSSAVLIFILKFQFMFVFCTIRIAKNYIKRQPY